VTNSYSLKKTICIVSKTVLTG